MKIEIEIAEVSKCEADEEEMENQCHLDGIFNLDKNEVGNSSSPLSSSAKPVKEDEEVEKILEEQHQE